MFRVCVVQTDSSAREHAPIVLRPLVKGKS